MSPLARPWPIVGRHSELDLFDRVLRAGDQAGVLIHGFAGVGKTRLAAECRAVAAEAGHPTEWVTGSVTTATLPLGAVAVLLDRTEGSTDEVDPVRLFERCRTNLHDRHGSGRVVVVADDLPLLDPASLSLLTYLLDQGTIFLLGTVRSGAPVPDLITALWRDERLGRIDLESLSRPAVDTLLHLALGGPLEIGAARSLWEVTRGNPLFVRELVLGGLAAGTLVERAGVWHLDDRPRSTERLVELVRQRIGHLDAAGRSLLELLALCQPLALSYVEHTTPPGLLEAMEESGLAAVDVGRQEVRIAHPLHAEVVVAAMPSARRRAVLRAQADRLERQGEDRDPLRVALWRLESDGGAAPEVLVRGARLARLGHDFRVVRRLLEAIPPDQLEPEAALLLGEALYELGAFDAADDVLARAQRLPSPEDLVLRLAVMRSKNLHWGHCRPDRALEVNTEARDRLISAPLLSELQANEAAIRVFSGHPQAALTVLDGMGVGDARTRVIRALAEAIALAMTGRTGDGVEVAATAFAEHLAIGDELAIAHPGTHIINQVFALTEAGRLDEAEALARSGAEVAAADRVPIAQIWFAVNLGRIATLQGRVQTARRYYAEGAGLAEANHFAGPRRLALAGMAFASGMLGDAVGAGEALAERDRLPPFGFAGSEATLADAWRAVAAGQPREAAALLRSAAAEANATGHRNTESWLLHDVVRISGGDEADRLVELAAVSDSRLVSARAAHAVARRRRDPGQLMAAADAFAAIGADLLAAEAATDAARAYRRAGDQRAATAASAQARALAGRCEGAETPGLVGTDAVVPLTDREREIAVLASEGVSSKEIAERLFLSVRTVNNHLQRAYVKLGVSNRADAAEALRRTP